jgi:predicted nucleic acid-binding protein
MRVYLDLCALKRPFERPQNDRVIVEALAVASLVRAFEQGRLDLVTSPALELENGNNPNQERREAAAEILGRMRTKASADNLVIARARQLHECGLRPLDALHAACAERVGCRYLVTCDDKLLRAGKRLASSLKIQIVNPLYIVDSL